MTGRPGQTRNRATKKEKEENIYVPKSLMV